ncbi:protoglobin domain-containing protein [Rummeliibacillus sp. NPDC094406]|uniref:protoglobin domain-containing protein n=1 Tax=Rummeliibacillus sp. NPDC094406 TaxID=3364511 RepID=UPI0038082794
MFAKSKKHYQYFSATPGSDINANKRFQIKLDFLGLSSIRRASVQGLRELYDEHHNEILDSFYGHLISFQEFREIIENHSSVERLKISFDKHFRSLFEDQLDLQYIFNRRKIAHTHAKLGVLPDWMISAYTLINQIIIPLILEKYSRNRKKMMDVLLAYETLVSIDQQLIVETYIEIQAGSIVNGLGEIIAFNTQLDQIKKLIQFQEMQKKDVISANSSMEQLDASIEEVSSSIVDVSNDTQSSLEELSKGIQLLRNVNELLRTTDQGQESVKENVSELENRVNNVTKLVEFIQGIAEQTNLLALNASIEAARAGAAGKGFAVVAEEVRKLADNTKSSVQSIHGDIQKLLEITKNISTLTKQSAEDLHKGVNETSNITTALSTLNDTLQHQGSSIEEIATATQQQAAAANDITVRNRNIAENAIKSKGISNDTGEAIYTLSRMIDNYRTKTISKNFIISQEDIVALTITDHLLWRWHIYNLLLGFGQMTVDDVKSHRESRLGEWYYGQGKELLGNEPTFKELEQPHARVHEVARKAVQAYNTGNYELAEEYLVEVEKCSKIVIDKLTKLREIIIASKEPYMH